MKVKLLQGDCLTVLRTLPAASVQTCVTSPPYYGLRDYGVDGQIGLEETPEAYIARLVAVFAEVRRVLKDDGTLWLNLGDSYNSAQTNRTGQNGYDDGRENRDKRFSVGGVDGLKPKDLLMIPARVAIALQADGWYLRSEIIWHKPNPMPESVTDRPTKSHEMIYLLAKSARYFYDADAVREDAETAKPESISYRANGKSDSRQKHKDAQGVTPNFQDASGFWKSADQKRNRRDVWTVATTPYSGAHFATFPPKLIEPCILAGTSARGECPKCGKAWIKIIEKEKPPAEVYAKNGKPEDIAAVSHPEAGKVAMGQKLQNWYNEHPPKVAGWRAQCDCEIEPVPQTVLDPFNGSGTTGAVSVQHGRDYIGIELNPDYLELAKKRIGDVQERLFA